MVLFWRPVILWDREYLSISVSRTVVRSFRLFIHRSTSAGEIWFDSHFDAFVSFSAQLNRFPLFPLLLLLLLVGLFMFVYSFSYALQIERAVNGYSDCEWECWFGWIAQRIGLLTLSIQTVEVFEKNISNLIKLQKLRIPSLPFSVLLLSGYGIAARRLLWLFKIIFDPMAKIYELLSTEQQQQRQPQHKNTHSN